MQVGPFDIEIPDPPLRDPHAVVVLRPWINVGNVGSVVLGRLKATFDGAEIGRLRRPGYFYDFTRYRPEMKLVEGERHVTVPNTVVLAARRQSPPDLVLIHLMEPHANAEEYNEAILEILDALGVKAYVSIGSMYDSVPHSRPLQVSGSMKGWDQPPDLGDFTVSQSKYEGPTSITGQISQMANEKGIATINLMVRLPLYLQLDNDFSGSARAMEILSPLYGLGDVSGERELGRRQYEQVTPSVLKDEELAQMVRRLEREYDRKIAATDQETDETVELSPEIERFLDQLRRRVDEGPSDDEDEPGDRGD
jgi:hypothetical protein